MKPQSSFLEKPMNTAGAFFRERIFPIAAAALALLLMIYYLSREMFLPETRETLIFPVTLTASALILLSLRMLREKKPPELRLLLQNACWVIVTRLLLGRLNYKIDGENYWALMFFCLFGVGVSLKRKYRDVFLTAVTVVLCTILSMWAAAGILTAMRGAQLPGIPWLFQNVSIAEESSLVFIALFDFHRNTSAIFFLPAICLMIYQCIRHRHWGWYAAAGITIPLLYAIIAVQHCRSAYLSSAVCLSLLLGRLVLRKLEKHGRVLGIIAAVVVTAVFTVGLYEGFFACSNQIAGLSRTHQVEETAAAVKTTPEATEKPAETTATAKPAESKATAKPSDTTPKATAKPADTTPKATAKPTESAATAKTAETTPKATAKPAESKATAKPAETTPKATAKPAESKAPAKPAETTPKATKEPAESTATPKPAEPEKTDEPDAAEKLINDSRSTLKDARTLTGRTQIWKALFQLIRLKPKIALWGRGFEPLIKPIRELVGRKSIQHMHNILFQQLLLAGFPGFLMYFFFLLSLAVRIVKCFFRMEGQGREESFALGAALTGVMIYGMFEPVMSTIQPIISVIFCLLAGCFVGELSDGGERKPG